MLNKASSLFVISLLLAGSGMLSRVSAVESVAPITVNCAKHVRSSNAIGDFLCAHNASRAAIKPAPARSLPKLAWNKHLAAVAQSYAESCTWAHNENRNSHYAARSGDRVVVGENLFISTYPTVSPYDAVKSWASEAHFYNYKKNTCAKGQACGHYTQVVWRDTRQVGCGSAICSKVANSSLTNAAVMVCNYAPSGNFVGERPY